MSGSKRAMLALALSLLSACATIRNGRHQQIQVSSNPAGADVSIRCADHVPITAVTPATIAVNRRSLPCQVTLRKEGYRDQELVLQRRISKAFWANLLWSPALWIGGYAAGHTCNGGNVVTGGGRFGCTTRTEEAAIFFVLGIIPAGIGMGVDAGTGAMYESVPRGVDVTLPPR